MLAITSSESPLEQEDGWDVRYREQSSMAGCGRRLPLGMRSRKQPLAVRHDVATDRFRTECPMSTIGQKQTVSLSS